KKSLSFLCWHYTHPIPYFDDYQITVSVPEQAIIEMKKQGFSMYGEWWNYKIEKKCETCGGTKIAKDSLAEDMMKLDLNNYKLNKKNEKILKDMGFRSIKKKTNRCFTLFCNIPN